MSKQDATKDETITISRAEYEANLAKAAASASVHTQRGLVGNEGMLATVEERVAQQTGRPVPERRPWPAEVALARYEDHLMGGIVEFTVDIQVKDRDANGEPIEPIRTVTRVRGIRFPPLETMQRVFGLDDNSAIVAIGGKVRSDIKEGVRFSIPFVQRVADVYEKPLRALFQGRDIRHVKPYLVDGTKVRDLGEVRRENDGAASGRVN